MTESLWTIRRLHTAYRVNGLLYRLRFLGLSYESRACKRLGLLLALLREVGGQLLGKSLYVLLLVLLPQRLSPQPLPEGFALHVLLCLSLAGVSWGESLFAARESSYYAVFLLRMDARRYALSCYGYGLLRAVLCAAAVAALWGLEPLPALVLVLLPAGTRLLRDGLRLRRFRRRGRVDGGALGLLWAALGLAAGYVPPLLLGWALPPWLSGALAGVLLLCAVPAGRAIWRFADYRGLYRRVLDPETLRLLRGDEPEGGETYVQTRLEREDGEQTPPEGERCGFGWFSERFFRRNRRLLLRPARRTALLLAALLGLGCLGCLLLPELRGLLHGRVLSALPLLPLLMYFLNRGHSVTRVLFLSCDRSMLHYGFYRQGRVIRGVFAARLRALLRINLPPTLVLALGLPLLLLCSGGGAAADYLLLSLTVLALGLFFSVHYLVLYYLLQPYTVGLDRLGLGYRLASGLTYAVSYGCWASFSRLEGSELPFALAAIGFAALYVPLALLLADRLAPRTFRLRE